MDRYIKGFLIGMIVEYSYRVEFGILQAIILTALIYSMIIELYFKKNG